jgi:hypothetical protein
MLAAHFSSPARPSSCPVPTGRNVGTCCPSGQAKQADVKMGIRVGDRHSSKGAIWAQSRQQVTYTLPCPPDTTRAARSDQQDVVQRLKRLVPTAGSMSCLRDRRRRRACNGSSPFRLCGPIAPLPAQFRGVLVAKDRAGLRAVLAAGRHFRAFTISCDLYRGAPGSPQWLTKQLRIANATHLTPRFACCRLRTPAARRGCPLTPF